METSWQIFDKSGVVLCVAHELEYTGNWMGDVFVSVTVKSADPIAFSIGDWLVYRGETFTLDYEPTVLKKARRGSYGEGFTYQGIKFRSRQEELTRCMFLDVVLSDNEEHYTSMPNFSFFAENVTDLLERVQANLDRMYYDETTGEGLWEIEVVAKDATGKKRRYKSKVDMSDASGFEIVNQNISIQSQSCWDALGLASSTFELNFYIRGRKIVVGDYDDDFSEYVEEAVGDEDFRYGKGKGLYEIESKSDDGKSVVTRLRAYGNTTNMPNRYYQRKTRELLLDYDWSSIAFTRAAASYYSVGTSLVGLGVADDGTIANALRKYGQSYGEDVVLNNVTGRKFIVEVEVVSLHDASVKLRCNMEISVFGDYEQSVNGLFRLSQSENETTWDAILNMLGLAGIYGSGYFGGVSIVGLSTDEMWLDWPEGLKIDDFPTALAVSNLMLPGFPMESLADFVGEVSGDTQTYSEERFDPYINSKNIDDFGIREYSITFDGNGDLDDIYPTLEEITAGDARKAGLLISSGFSDNERLDELEDYEHVNDDGIVTSDGQKMPDAVVWLRDIGFDLYKSVREATEKPKLSMKTGFCGGREFEIKRVVRGEETDEWAHMSDVARSRCKWKLYLGRVYDDALDRWFPYSVNESEDAYNLLTGDRFVLLGIDLPEEYIRIAEARLLLAAKEWLADNDYTRMVYTPKVDNILLANNRDACIASGCEEHSVYWWLKEGMLFHFTDDDLSVRGELVVDTLRIKESGDKIPEVELTLREEKKVSSLSRLQNEIKSIRYGVSGSGGITREQLSAAVKETGDALYVKKTDSDTMRGTLTASGFVGDAATLGRVQSGDYEANLSGYELRSGSGGSRLEVDEVFVRRRMIAEELELRKVSYSAGRFVFSMAGSTIIRVEKLYGTTSGVVASGDDVVASLLSGGEVLNVVVQTGVSDEVTGWRCYFKADDGTQQTRNLWREGDWALCETLNLETNRYYWRKVTGCGVDYIDLSAAEQDTENDDEPQIGDVVAQYGNGNVSDQNRQNAIVIDPSVPSFTQYAGIRGPRINVGVVVTKFTPTENFLTGTLSINSRYGDEESDTFAEGVIASGLRMEKAYIANATIKNLQLERAKVSGFVLRDRFDLTAANYGDLALIGTTSIVSVYALGTTVFASGSGWSVTPILLSLPCVLGDDYTILHDTGNTQIVGVEYDGDGKVLKQCRELSGVKVTIYNGTDRGIKVKELSGDQYSTGGGVEFPIAKNTSIEICLDRSFESVYDRVTDRSINVETFRWRLEDSSTDIFFCDDETVQSD